MRLPLLALTTVAGALALAAPASATFTADVVGADAYVQGDGALVDSVQVSTSGNFVSHNLTGAGYASPIDWNSTAGITETVPTSGVIRVHIDGGAGGDIIAIGDGTVSASDFHVPFDVDGGAGNDGLILNSDKDQSGRTVTLTSSLGDSYVSYSTGSYVEHSGFDGAIVDLGEGSDVVTAQGVDDLEPIAIYGGGGNDRLVAGTKGAGLGGVQGPVQFRGDAGDDTVQVDDAAGGGVYTIDPTAVRRGGASIAPDPSVEHVSLTTGAGNDSIYKQSARPITIASGGGDDLIASRDAAADPVDCGDGSDFVLSDPLDALAANCDQSDRQTASGAGGGAGTQTPGDQQPGTDDTAPARDTTAPTAIVTVPKTIRLKALRRGLKLKVATDEPSAVQVELLGSTSTARLARAFNLTLGQASLPLGPGVRDLKVKPERRLVGRSRRFTVRVLVTVTDAAGNRSTVARALKVRA